MDTFPKCNLRCISQKEVFQNVCQLQVSFKNSGLNWFSTSRFLRPSLVLVNMVHFPLASGSMSEGSLAYPECCPGVRLLLLQLESPALLLPGCVYTAGHFTPLQLMSSFAWVKELVLGISRIQSVSIPESRLTRNFEFLRAKSLNCQRTLEWQLPQSAQWCLLPLLTQTFVLDLFIISSVQLWSLAVTHSDPIACSKFSARFLPSLVQLLWLSHLHLRHVRILWVIPLCQLTCPVVLSSQTSPAAPPTLSSAVVSGCWFFSYHFVYFLYLPHFFLQTLNSSFIFSFFPKLPLPSFPSSHSHCSLWVPCVPLGRSYNSPPGLVPWKLTFLSMETL